MYIQSVFREPSSRRIQSITREFCWYQLLYVATQHCMNKSPFSYSPIQVTSTHHLSLNALKCKLLIGIEASYWYEFLYTLPVCSNSVSKISPVNALRVKFVSGKLFFRSFISKSTGSTVLSWNSVSTCSFIYCSVLESAQSLVWVLKKWKRFWKSCASHICYHYDIGSILSGLPKCCCCWNLLSNFQLHTIVIRSYSAKH